MPLTREQAEKAMKMAEENYDEGGHWVVECNTIEDLMEGFHSIEEVKLHYQIVQDRYLDIQGY